MPELFRKIKAHIPRWLVILAPAALILALTVLTASLLRTPQPPAPEPSQPSSTPSPTPSPSPAPILLVTAEQMAKLSYTDSVLGRLSWNISEESLLELNHILVSYEIITAEEICQFLAQATVETGAGLQLTELGDEDYFRSRGYSTGTRGAGYLHLTHKYGQMGFATWMMKRHIPALKDISFVNPASNGAEDVAAAYYAALQTAANLGVNVSRYSRIVYDPNSSLSTGADYIASSFAWESAAYYWHIAGVKQVLADPNGGVDSVSAVIGGGGWQSRREAYEAFRPILVGMEEPLSAP